MFYVGQKVVAIKNHSEGVFKKGDTYVVEELIQCVCGILYLSIGIIFQTPMHLQKPKCTKCGHKYPPQKHLFHDSKNFAPLEEYSDSMSIAMQLVQEIDQTDKQKIFNPKRETVKN